MCEHLQAITEGKLANLVINIPPRFGKSITVSIAWPAWEWIRDPKHRYLCLSYNESLAIEHSLKCRNLILSPWYQERFSHIYQLSTDQNEKKRFDNDQRGYRIASGLTGALGKGGDRCILDDPMSVEDATSDIERKKALDFYDGTLRTRLGYKKGTATICVMQRLFEDDMAAHLLELGFEHLNLPNEYEPERTKTTCIGWSDPRKETGELLWPVGCDDEATVVLKKQGSLHYASQFQQRPVPAGGNIIQSAWWKFWKVLPTKKSGDDLVEDFDTQLFVWDLTFDGKHNSDFVVGQLWGKKGANIYLIDQVRGRWDFTQTITQFIAFSAKYPHVTTKLVENKANGPAIISALRQKISGILPIDPKTSKEARIIAVTPEIEAGNVFLPDPEIDKYNWVRSFIEECSYFPKGANDDQLDAAAYALWRLKTGGQANILEFYQRQVDEILSQAQPK